MADRAYLLTLLVCGLALFINGLSTKHKRPDVFTHPVPVVPGDCGPPVLVSCKSPTDCKTNNNPGANEAFICQQKCLYCYVCAAYGDVKPIKKKICEYKESTCCSAEINPLIHFNNREVDCGQYKPCRASFNSHVSKGITTPKTSSVNKKVTQKGSKGKGKKTPSKTSKNKSKKHSKGAKKTKKSKKGNKKVMKKKTNKNKKK